MEQTLWKAVPDYLRRVSNALKKVQCQFLLVHNQYSLPFMFSYGFVNSAYRKASSFNLHPNKIWVVDGR